MRSILVISAWLLAVDAMPALAADQFCRSLAPPANGNACSTTVLKRGAGRLLTGNVLTPDGILTGGQVLIDANGVIACVGCDCSAQARNAVGLTCPGAVISPGLINPHDHLTFTQNAPGTGEERYEHRHDWRRGVRGHTMIPAPGGATAQQVQWGELRFVLGGATSTAGVGGARGFLRNLDNPVQLEGLAIPAARPNTFPLDDAGGILRAGDCDYGHAPDTAAGIAIFPAYLAHAAEGIDAAARNEYPCIADPAFDTAPQVGGGGSSNDLIRAGSSIVHGMALEPADYAEMAQSGAGLVWSPRSNLSLYGDTAQVTVAARKGVNIALGTDWTVSGSVNVLRELRCADDFNRNHLDSFFTSRQLWEMATVNAARAAGVSGRIGELRVGQAGDVAIFDGRARPGYRAVIEAGPQDVLAVFRGGKLLYGERFASLQLAPDAACDALNVCGRSKSVCTVRETGLPLMVLQALNRASYPAFFCGTPAAEPSCRPQRAVSVNGSTVYDGVARVGDPDGDGISDPEDDCPRMFNPVRPMDDGVPADADGDGMGDVCDPVP